VQSLEWGQHQLAMVLNISGTAQVQPTKDTEGIKKRNRPAGLSESKTNYYGDCQ